MPNLLENLNKEQKELDKGEENMIFTTNTSGKIRFSLSNTAYEEWGGWEGTHTHTHTHTHTYYSC